MKILHLTLKKKWFDLIASGQKTVEYREDKSYWRKRLLNNEVPKHFDVIRFKNGYRKTAPSMDVQFKGISFVNKKDCMPANGEILTENLIVIKLGKIIKKTY